MLPALAELADGSDHCLGGYSISGSAIMRVGGWGWVGWGWGGGWGGWGWGGWVGWWGGVGGEDPAPKSARSGLSLANGPQNPWASFQLFALRVSDGTWTGRRFVRNHLSKTLGAVE